MNQKGYSNKQCKKRNRFPERGGGQCRTNGVCNHHQNQPDDAPVAASSVASRPETHPKVRAGAVPQDNAKQHGRVDKAVGQWRKQDTASTYENVSNRKCVGTY